MMFRNTALWIVLCAALPTAGAQEDLLLPDITIRRSDLFDNDIRTNIVPGRTHLRLSNGTPNVGVGKFYVYGAPAEPGSDAQPVIQRIFREDGSFIERESGQFVYHSAHSHIHIEAWSIYRLRRVLPDDGVGEIVAEGEKTSFCILDLAIFDRSLENYSPRGEFHSCSSTIQGLSVGWVDIYSKSLPGQNIDITGLAGGQYWLEAHVDPEDHFLELNEDNNIERVLVTIPGSGEIEQDAFEPNDDSSEIDSRPQGGFNSPNLGPTNPKRTISELTLHERGDQDFFKFYLPATGSLSDFVRIDFVDIQGNLQLELLDSDRQPIANSTGNGDSEIISLEGLPAGWHYARVYGENNAISERYSLTVNPSSNLSPDIEILKPEKGDVRLPHGFETFTVIWSADDAEDGPTWVTVYLNESRMLDGNEHILPASLHTQGVTGFHIINSADVPPGTYWVYCRITDGGTTTGAWSQGTVTFFDVPEDCVARAGAPDDCDSNGIVDSCDIESGAAADCDGNGVPDSCDIAAGTLPDIDGDGVPDRCDGPSFHRGDSNGDGSFDISDAVRVLDFLFLGGSINCVEASDVNNDHSVDVTDGIRILNYLFMSGPAPASPGPTNSPCGLDTDPVGSEGDLGCESYALCE